MHQEFRPENYFAREAASILDRRWCPYTIITNVERQAVCPKSTLQQAGGFSVVLEAMQRLVGNGSLQVKGTEMLQTLVNEEPQVGVVCTHAQEGRRKDAWFQPRSQQVLGIE